MTTGPTHEAPDLRAVQGPQPAPLPAHRAALVERIKALAGEYADRNRGTIFGRLDSLTWCQLTEALDQLAAAPAAAPAWQPIETAPKDMGAYLFLCNGITLEGFRDATGALCVRRENGCGWRKMGGKPSHWTHLLPAPRPESMRCAGCDLINGCPEYCRCTPAFEAPATVAGSADHG